MKGWLWLAVGGGVLWLVLRPATPATTPATSSTPPKEQGLDQELGPRVWPTIVPDPCAEIESEWWRKACERTLR